MLLRRISEIGGNGSATVANAYQKGVVNSRRNGICSLRDLEKSSEKSLDYAAKAIRYVNDALPDNSHFKV